MKVFPYLQNLLLILACQGHIHVQDQLLILAVIFRITSIRLAVHSKNSDGLNIHADIVAKRTRHAELALGILEVNLGNSVLDE